MRSLRSSASAVPMPDRWENVGSDGVPGARLDFLHPDGSEVPAQNHDELAANRKRNEPPALEPVARPLRGMITGIRSGPAGVRSWRRRKSRPWRGAESARF